MTKYAIGFAAGVVAMWVFGPSLRAAILKSPLGPYARQLPTDLEVSGAAPTSQGY